MITQITFFVALISNAGQRYSGVQTLEIAEDAVHGKFNDWLREETVKFQQAVPGQSITIENCKIIR